jgi:hypothetical protein
MKICLFNIEGEEIDQAETGETGERWEP